MIRKQKATLFGIGVGPGDPDLITVKAVRLLKEMDVIYTASSTKNNFSLALQIASPHIPENAEIHALSFPMTRDKNVTDHAWKEHASAIYQDIHQGKNVAFLTLGDPLTYATFGYILQKMNKLYPDVPVETVPGITSYQAAAARTNTPLVEAEESLLITSGAAGGENLRKLNGQIENIVLLKAYKNVDGILEALAEADMLNTSIAVSKCGRDGETITRDIKTLKDHQPDYWTLIIAKKNNSQ